MVSHCIINECKNNRENDSNVNLLFHVFPLNPVLKARWLKAIGRPDWEPPDNACICNDHFITLQLNSNFEGSLVEVCRICLATNDNVALYSLQQGNLKKYIKTILPFYNDPNLPQFVCFECAAHLRKSYDMIKKSETSQEILLKIFEQNGEITKSLIKNLNRESLELKSPLEPHRVTPTYLFDYKFNHEKNVSFLTSNNYVYDLNEVKIELNTKPESFTVQTNQDDDSNDVTENSEQDSNGVIKSTSYNVSCDENETNVEQLQELNLSDDEINSTWLIEGSRENNKNEKDANRVAKPVSDHVPSDDNDSDVENVKNNSTVCIDLISEESTDGNPVSADENIKNDSSNEEKRVKRRKVKNKIETTHSRKQSAKDDGNSIDVEKHFYVVDLITIRERKEAWNKAMENPHWIKHEEQLKNVHKCEVCSKLFANVKSYEQHRAYHEPSYGVAECPICKIRQRTEKFVTKHIVKCHSKKYDCKLCLKSYLNRVSAIKHYLEHIGREYKCKRCSYSTRHKSILSVHILRAHPHAFACELCGRTCVSRAGLNRHYQMVHPRQHLVSEGGEAFSCKDCKLKFISENALRVHLLTSAQHRDMSRDVPELQNACKLCGASFQLHSELTEHKKTEHNIEEMRSIKTKKEKKYPSKCDYCDVLLPSSHHVYWHLRQNHPEHKYNKRKPATAVICSTCGRGFKNPYYLRYHELRHGSPCERCDQCGRMFYDKFQLARHHDSYHSDERPYSCDVCHRAFKHKGNMARHMLIHTDVTPYECSLCGKQVKHEAGLKLHIRTVHDKIYYPSVLNRKKRTRKRTEKTKPPA